MNRLIFLTIISIICSCENNDSCEEIMEKYEGEKIKLVHIYPNCTEKQTYTRIHFYPNGQKSSYGFYENHMKSGEFKTWYENGQLSAIWQAEKGKTKGMVKCYREDGTIEREALTEGDFKGYFKFYNEDEKITSEGNLLNDSTKIGKWIEYYENGNTEYIWDYKSGKLNGICSTYYENGVLEGILIFEEGYLKDTVGMYDSEGNELYFERRK